MTAGRGVEHGTAPESRLRAQDDAIAAGRDDGTVEPQLGEPIAEAHHPCRDVRPSR